MKDKGKYNISDITMIFRRTKLSLEFLGGHTGSFANRIECGDLQTGEFLRSQLRLHTFEDIFFA